MKKILCAITALAVFSAGMRADEGMWMLPLLQKMNSKTMTELGCRLSADDIYSINHSSLKDAIVQFGGGCTGEIISGEGLLVTNHHCGYASIQKLSSVDHDYLTDGYWAMNRSEELPVEGLTVTFLESMTDITAALNKAEKQALKEYRNRPAAELDSLVAKAVSDKETELMKKAQDSNPHCDVEGISFYNNNVKYIIVYKTYKDIRFVGAPPSSIGKFGADTDNWMWPRHTGDFSMFRVYADKDNNPAEYSKDNVPYTPKNHLKISLKGFNEGDYAMIMGYPGRTNRFYTSPELQSLLDLQDISIEARTIRQDIMMEDMLADPKVKIQYASKYAGSSNGWKKWIGMKQAFAKLNVIGRAEEEEAAFTAWVNASPKRQEVYGNALGQIKEGVESGRTANRIARTAIESVFRIELSSIATTFNNAAKTSLKATEVKDTLKAFEDAFAAVADLYKDYSVSTDIKEAKALLNYYRTHVDSTYYLKGLGEDFGTMDIDKYVDELFAASVFSSADKLSEAIDSPDRAEIFSDPAISLARAAGAVLTPLYTDINKSDSLLAAGRKAYTAGLLEWKKDEPSYPDANFTMRLTYGTIKGYSPKDAVTYKYYTTLDGVMEKEDPDNWEFVVPAKLKELWKAQDFGDYALPDGKMPVAFLSNNDITGGNSGSPVLNADGELIGLAFDGNWESMSSDIMFEPDLQRCINVDIRYVLFIVDKFGGAGYLLDEMDIVK
ncbi:MAG: S46 family peptidase [Bacteroidetes bacterium]|uniref:Dipeptidyl-peptidase n=1 Tax=Candidatus Cryptobacteroides merdavium TaxID=2840769 RepID=A0A9D9EDJ0_9BACT|nr:S46 family peptidase [Candidatus Cryptobacteroides merdavium]